jgi:hypothetical protein
MPNGLLCSSVKVYSFIPAPQWVEHSGNSIQVKKLAEASSVRSLVLERKDKKPKKQDSSPLTQKRGIHERVEQWQHNRTSDNGFGIVTAGIRLT